MTLLKPYADTDFSEAEFSSLLFSNSTANQGLARILGFSLLYHTYRSSKSPTGFPDWVLVRERVLFVELKRESGKPTTAQSEWLDGLRTAGAEAYLWRPSDLTDGEISRVLQHRGPLARESCATCGRVFVHRRTCVPRLPLDSAIP